jgi:hypothetical protein
MCDVRPGVVDQERCDREPDAAHVATVDGPCRPCTAPGQGTPQKAWPCSLWRLAEGTATGVPRAPMSCGRDRHGRRLRCLGDRSVASTPFPVINHPGQPGSHRNPPTSAATARTSGRSDPANHHPYIHIGPPRQLGTGHPVRCGAGEERAPGRRRPGRVPPHPLPRDGGGLTDEHAGAVSARRTARSPTRRCGSGAPPPRAPGRSRARSASPSCGRRAPAPCWCRRSRRPPGARRSGAARGR